MVQLRVRIEDPEVADEDEVTLVLAGRQSWTGVAQSGQVVFDVPDDLGDDALLVLLVLGREARVRWRELPTVSRRELPTEPVEWVVAADTPPHEADGGEDLRHGVEGRFDQVHLLAPPILGDERVQVPEVPRGPGFAFRLDPDRPADVQRAAGQVDRGVFPVDEVGVRYSVHFLEPTTELDLGGAVVTGVCREFETHWEPLGWALEDWIATTSQAPAQDGLTSEVTVRGMAQLREDKGAGVQAATRASASSVGSTRETMSLATSSVGTSRGVNIGAGGSSTQSGTRALTDPVATLVNAVTGAFQFGYSSGRATNQGTSEGSLTREITSGISQASVQMREEQASLLVRSANDLSETRTLSAAVNPSASSATNLAVFSVVRQWLVSTAEVARRPALFVPIDRLFEDFTTADVFLHRDLLSPALLDTSLRETLDAVARDWVPPSAPARPAPAPASPTVHRLVGHLSLSDPAEGRGSSLLLGAQVDVEGTVQTVGPVTLGPPAVGQRVDFEIPVRPGRLRVDQIRAVTVEFVNPGPFVKDWRAELSELTLEAVLSDATVQQIGTWAQKEIRAGAAEPLKIAEQDADQSGSASEHPQAQATTVSASTGVPASTARLLAHLNHHKAFYRLALDLQQDAVTRYARLRERFPGVHPLPRDMRPLGVLGTHVAFRAVSGDPSHEAVQDPQVTRELISMPSDGTWMEAVPGATVVPAAESGKATTVAFADATWPVTTELTAAAVSAYAPGALGTTTAEQPTTGSPDLSGIVDKFSTDLAASLGGLLAAAITEATKAAEGAEPPAEPGAGETAAESPTPSPDEEGTTGPGA